MDVSNGIYWNAFPSFREMLLGAHILWLFALVAVVLLAQDDLETGKVCEGELIVTSFAIGWLPYVSNKCDPRVEQDATVEYKGTLVCQQNATSISWDEFQSQCFQR